MITNISKQKWLEIKFILLFCRAHMVVDIVSHDTFSQISEKPRIQNGSKNKRMFICLNNPMIDFINLETLKPEI